MGLQARECFFLQELFEVFAEMAVIIITVLLIAKARGVGSQLLHGFAYPQYLQRFLTAQARRAFEIPVQGPRRHLVLCRKFFHCFCKIILPVAIL